jgi:hypothetical protein
MGPTEVSSKGKENALINLGLLRLSNALSLWKNMLEQKHRAVEQIHSGKGCLEIRR